jgi:tRNA threonylcarbamoyl adenosine modification protein YeaZ
MKILAIDFSSTQRSVAVRSGNVESEIVETDAKKTEVLGMIEQALCGAHVDRGQIECIAIGLGPGSYTGMRAAIALAQGWQLAHDVKLMGISGAEAISVQAHADGLRGLVNVVIDAQRGEFYLAHYQLDDSGAKEIASLKIVSIDELRKREQGGELIVGPEVTRWFPNGRIVFPRAATLARLAAQRTDFISGDKLEPIYLRETSFVKAPPPRVIV